LIQTNAKQQKNLTQAKIFGKYTST